MVKTGMITNRWIDRRRPSWDRLSALLGTANGRRLKTLSADELRETAFLYRQIASDLSALQQDGTAPTLTAYVNQLLARSHNFVYSGRRTSATEAVRFLWVEYPRLIRRLHGFVHASLLLFLAGAVLGSLLTLARPELIGWNGLLLGVVGTACAQAHMSASLWSFVAAHGSLELPAIVLSGAAGLRLAQGLLFPGPYSRRYALTETGRDAVKVMAGVIPMLVVAGMLEGFLSPSGAPKALKFAVGSLLFTLLIVWLRMEHLEPARRGAGSERRLD